MNLGYLNSNINMISRIIYLDIWWSTLQSDCEGGKMKVRGRAWLLVDMSHVTVM